MVIGTPADWADLIDSMVPVILELVIASWEAMPSPGSGDKEDKITEALCRILRQNRRARDLPFQIHVQFVELEPANDEKLGRLDIVFVPLINREDIYFCLECKRLNAVTDTGESRAYASEYVRFGMLRFVRGQYSQAVHHGGMMAYVLDGDVAGAIANVETNIKTHHVELGMRPPGAFLLSSILEDEPRARETHHQRAHDNASLFRIHHLFMPRASG